MHRHLLIVLLLLTVMMATAAQEEDDPIINAGDVPLPTTTPEAVPTESHTADALPGNGALLIEIEATDGLTLGGEFFPAYGGDGRAIVLLHELYTTQVSWYPLIEPLRGAGFHVLAVDLRGAGGLTRWAINWQQAEADTLTWLAWLAAQDGVRPEAVFTMGSSMGSNLAINGCAAFETCAGAVAVSPGRNYFGVYTADALALGKPTLIIYAERDYYPRRDVPDLREIAGFNGEVWVLAGNAHGMDLFTVEGALLADIIGWVLGW